MTVVEWADIRSYHTSLKSILIFLVCFIVCYRADAQSYPPMTGFVDMHARLRGDPAVG
jgi:hypothetical protein